MTDEPKRKTERFWVIGAGVVIVALLFGFSMWAAVKGGRGKNRSAREQQSTAQQVIEDARTRSTGGAKIGRIGSTVVWPAPHPAQAPKQPVIVAGPDNQPEPRHKKQPKAPGQRAVAMVQRVGKQYELTPNQVGAFQRIYVKPSEQIPVQVAYPEGKPGETVTIEAEDSGRVVGAKGWVSLEQLDEQSALSFVFQVSENLGTHRVLLRKGRDVKVLDFWVGNELPLRQD